MPQIVTSNKPKLISLAVFTLFTALILTAKAFCLGEGLTAQKDTFDSELPFNEAMTKGTGNCNLLDNSVSTLDYTDQVFLEHQGERRYFYNSASGGSSTVHIGTIAKLWYYYKVYGRTDSGNFMDPNLFTASGCPSASYVASTCGYMSCPYGYTFYNEVCDCSYPESPIILNLSGGQKFDISTAEDGILFDLNMDNRLERIASPLEADVVGFLYLKDPIDHNGRNLFGNRSPQKKVEGQEPNGFLALKAWDDQQVGRDANGKLAIVGPPDGKITPSDGVWKNLLRVWFDRNRNGLADEGELKTLDELGIVALETNYEVVNRRDDNGNAIKMLGKFWKANDPQPYFMVDYWAATINPQ